MGSVTTIPDPPLAEWLDEAGVIWTGSDYQEVAKLTPANLGFLRERIKLFAAEQRAAAVAEFIESIQPNIDEMQRILKS
jgi:hypothetical protein